MNYPSRKDASIKSEKNRLIIVANVSKKKKIMSCLPFKISKHN